LVGKSLVLALTCDQPRVTAFDAGTWGPVVRRRQIVVPYYPGTVHYLPQEGLFARIIRLMKKNAYLGEKGLDSISPVW